MGNLITDKEIAERWESSNLGTYSWLFPRQFMMIPILEDIIKKADAVLDGSSDHIADLRFGHDDCLGPLHILMGICLLNGKEASLPLTTDNYPYYKWSDFRQFYTARCNANK